MDINICQIDDFDFDKITLSKSVYLGNGRRKMSIGYDKHADFHLLTPFFVSDHNYTQYDQSLKLIFDPMLGPILKFYNFINNVLESIKTKINKNNPEYILQQLFKNNVADDVNIFIDDDNSTSQPINCIKTIFLKLTNSYLNSRSESKYTPTCKIYNQFSNECDIDLLKLGWHFKALIKIDHIWINIRTKKYGLNIDLIQLKIFQPIYQFKCLIDTNDKHESLNHSQFSKIVSKSVNLESELPPYIKPSDRQSIQSIQSIQSSQNQLIEPPKIIFRPPKPDQLLLLKNSLKKSINTDNESESK